MRAIESRHEKPPELIARETPLGHRLPDIWSDRGRRLCCHNALCLALRILVRRVVHTWRHAYGIPPRGILRQSEHVRTNPTFLLRIHLVLGQARSRNLRRPSGAWNTISAIDSRHRGRDIRIRFGGTNSLRRRFRIVGNVPVVRHLGGVGAFGGQPSLLRCSLPICDDNYLALCVHKDLASTPPPHRLLAAQVLLGFFMALAAFTSYATLFWLFALAVCDLCLVVSKHARPNTLLPYAFASLWYSPYLITMAYEILVRHASRNLNVFWPFTPIPPPNLHSIVSVYTTMCDNAVVLFLYLASICYFGVTLLARKLGLSVGRQGLAIVGSFILCPILMIAEIYVYSAFLFPSGSMFLTRYFLLFWPMLCLTIGFWLKTILEMIRHHSVGDGTTVIAWSLVGALLIMRLYPWADSINTSTKYQVESQFTTEATYVLAQPDIYSPGTVVYMPYEPTQVDGWGWYYLTGQGSRPGVTFTSSLPVNANRVYLCLAYGGSPSEELLGQYSVVTSDPNSGVWTLQRK